MNEKKERDISKWMSDSQFQKLIKSGGTLLNILKMTEYEISVIHKNLKEDPANQVWRRLYARTIYSYIEAACYGMKQITYNMFAEDKDKKLSREEVAMLLEESYYLNKGGNAKKQEKYPRAASNLKFALKIFARTIENKSFVLDGGWEDYLKGKEIRDRITHPKSVSDLKISKKEVKKLGKVFKWFQEKFSQLIVFEK